MRYNVITFGKKRQNLNLAIVNKTIGSFMGTFGEHVGTDSIIFLHCERKIWGKAKVSSQYFYSEEPLWSDKRYPHRFKISDILLTDDPLELTNGHYNVELRKRYGTGWAYRFLFSPKPLPYEIGQELEVEFNEKRKVRIEDFLVDYN